MKPFTPALALAAAAATLGMSVAVAQTTPPPAQAQAPFAVPPYKNLKVLSKDITRPQLLSTMKLFSQSLGVRCTYCHVGTEGQPLSTFDFASDAKDKKIRAREMLVMVHRINEQDFHVTDFSQVKVTCFTCHRGSTKPLIAPPPGSPNTVPPPPAATPTKPERGAA